MSNDFRKKIEMICKFACVKYELVNGNIISIPMPVDVAVDACDCENTCLFMIQYKYLNYQVFSIDLK